MPEGISLSSNVRLFADDTVVYMAITSDIDAEKLQDDLNKPADWEIRWLMTFHPEKCNVLRIPKNGNVIKRTTSYMDYILHKASSSLSAVENDLNSDIVEIKNCCDENQMLIKNKVYSNRNATKTFPA